MCIPQNLFFAAVIYSPRSRFPAQPTLTPICHIFHRRS